MSVVIKTEDNVKSDIYKIIRKCPNNLEEKMLIAKNIIKLCINKDKRKPIYGNLAEIQNLIGVDEATLKVADSSSLMVKSFSDWFHEKKLGKMRPFFITFENLRSVITRMYIEEFTVVTVPRLLYTLQRMYINYNEGTLRNDFKHHGFTWKRLPGTKKSIVVERTDQFMERMAYLTKVKRYRQEGRYIVYLLMNKIIVAVSGVLGLINIDWSVAKESNLSCILRWLANMLTLFLPPNSVLIAAKSPHHEVTVVPKFSSPKVYICQWLKENDIMYDPQSPKAELFSLVKKFERKCPKAKSSIEELLKSHGHDILWRPTALPALDYFSRVSFDSNDISEVNDRENIFQTLTLEKWREFENDLIDKENKIYDEDLKVETIVDKLLTLGKYGELSSSDFDDGDNGLSDEEYISGLIQE